jgi:anti-anti-sigma regulatory factor
MNILVSQEQGRVPVTVLHLDGKLDGQNFHELIEKAGQVHAAGARDILIDAAGLSYISSAGLVALHSVTLMLRGEALPDPNQGWVALKSMERIRDGGIQSHIKLLNPRPEVIRVLDMVGFTTFFEIYTDLQTAVRSF